MDDRGECNPSQETLGKLCNMSIPTVNKAINSLLGKEVGGFLLLKRELINKGSRKYSNYRIPLLGECDTTAGEEVSEEVVQKPMTSPDVLKLFEATYRETYSVPYKASYKKELGMIKRSLLPAYTDDQIRIIIKTVFEEYDKRWKTPKYQTPTIGALCSWLGNQALKLSADKEKTKAVVSKWDNLENSDEDLIL
ncbi:hypothetical protein SDC9_110208 [bioreactor metagenome]|uniref:Uncharacterized protein n=1 Tax=bioreactor metagenome TaxID=1076179 RepID=A0A645BE48_9ZZZZ